MTSPQNPPAGWYPDPQGGPSLRWWDGTRWTADTQPSPHAQPAAPTPSYAAASTQPYQGGAAQPYPGAAAQLTAPEGTNWNTPWIWFVLFLPLLPFLFLPFLDWGNMVRIDPNTLEPDPYAQLSLFTSPAYILSVVSSWVSYGLTVLFAFLDWRELRHRGVPAPFHWAWAFLSSYVYGIGRGVVVQRRTGRGRIVMWISIAVLVLSLLIGIGIATAAIVAVFSQIPFSELRSRA